MILYDYDYDLSHQPFFTKVLDETREVTISFKIPDGVDSFSGFKVKLSRNGEPGNIYYYLERGERSGVIRSGVIYSKDVPPVFEIFVKGEFQPVGAKKGELFTLNLKIHKGVMPLDGYRIYGPNRNKANEFDAAEKIPYWWTEEYCHGMEVPKHYTPACYENSELVSIANEESRDSSGVSFGIITEEDVECGVEERFGFIKKLVSPPWSEWEPVKTEDNAGTDNDEIFVDRIWGIKFDKAVETTPLMDMVRKELCVFFEKSFRVSLLGRERYIVFKHGGSELPEGEESHIVAVTDTEITIIAKSDRGFLRAVHYIEDVMLEKRRASISKGVHRRESLYEVRMTNGVYPAPFNYYTLQSPEIWTDGYMWRLSRAGYNALWLSINLEEVVQDSSIFPELNDNGAGVAVERLKRITDKAASYGVDVYFEIKTGYYKWFSDEVYKRYPQIRAYPKWGNYPCTGSKVFREFLKETLGNVLEKVSNVKGIIIIYDTEGFYSCFTNGKQTDCPVCRNSTTEDLAARFLADLKAIVDEYTEDGELIAWTYFCDCDWNYRLMERLSPDIRLLSCYSQFVRIERFSVSNMTDDYACCVTGPSDYFGKVYDIASNRNIGIMAKTEVCFGQEFVGIPYIPCLSQHQKRWNSLSERKLYGFMGDYIHRGFIPSPCTDLMRLNIFGTEINGTQWLDSKEKIRWVASYNYGKDAIDDVVKAWELFSEAMTRFFPYSSGVCRYPGPLQAGPSQPFYLDEEREIKRKCARYNTGDLKWTEPHDFDRVDSGWNEELIRRCFIEFNRLYEEGIQCLEKACKKAGEYLDNLHGLVNIASIQVCMVNSMINFIDFVKLREEGIKTGSREVYPKMVKVCEEELENAQEALKLCSMDSNLGFSCEGQGTVRGGYFTLYTIKEKIGELEDTINELKHIR